MLLQTCSTIASKVRWVWPPIARPMLRVHSLKVYLHIELIAVFKFAHRGFEVHLHACWNMASKCISKLTLSGPPGSQNYCPRIDLQSRSITVSKYAQSWPPHSSPYWLNYGHQMHLQAEWLHGPMCISKFAHPVSAGASPIALKYHLQSDWLYAYI